MNKISIFNPESEFTKNQRARIEKLGDVFYLNPPSERELDELISFAKGSTIIAITPDNFGGFEKAKERVTQLLETLSQVKGIALDTTSYGWVDLDYCKKRNIAVTNLPGYSRESVAEQTLALLLCLAKRIIETDRKTQKGKYKLEMGFELKGKTLGVLGLGNIGERTAELGAAIGMRVVSYNRSPKTKKRVEMKDLNQFLNESDAIAIHVSHSEENKNLIDSKEIGKMKKGVIIVNFADREVVNEKAMADAIKSGKVFGYAYEAEDLENTPLNGLENAIGLKGFGWYTKETMDNRFQIWTENIISLAKGKPKNKV